ncbi:fungal-specific transcription factor domain-containing protein [Aspergillus pseudocaelatus]|uniref:Fungal-specific transcription factor domain-containing protein n=1 Tax=Aspergillus pseudocaelatus TaxID=1825620 RepID=A0ABQ6WT26_9EURO|nr:fungal-specific transcription factor domain-containing protein [Aspergillus pseudocaelatus]
MACIMTPGTPDHATSPTSSVTPRLSTRKHPLEDAYDGSDNRRKDPKVSRACDSCKVKKIRCSGTAPCEHCNRRRLICTYASKYSRGRPPTPPPLSTSREQETACTGQRSNAQHTGSRSTSNISENIQINERPQVNIAEEASGASVNVGDGAPSRASPELVIEGQYVDPTSGLTSFHQAWRKISMQKGVIQSPRSSEAEMNQPLVSAGDRPFYQDAHSSDPFPDALTARRLLNFYFESCVVTYRVFHQQTVESWLDTILDNRRANRPITHTIKNANYSIILTILAIARFRISKVERKFPNNDEASALQETDPLFCAAMHLTDTEKGFPRLESAQARLIQVLYLLQTSRVNRAWYVFGNVYQIVSSLGLHRRRSRKQNIPSNGPSNYVKAQCAKRVFWVTYTIDKYLSVVMGRPQLLHDDDIDQDFPDSVNDEDIGPDGLLSVEDPEDCHVDALIFHAKIAHIIGRTSRQVYSVGSSVGESRKAAAYRIVHELHVWRANLPLHLGTIKPSTLIPSFRREATALQLAYSHALIHVNRPFLLGDVVSSDDDPEAKDRIAECISAAKAVLELVNTMAKDTNLLHSFWWTHYVTFCALAVVYIWNIQCKARNGQQPENESSYVKLFDLAEKCRAQLAWTGSPASPGRKYAAILEELRLEAQRETINNTHTDSGQRMVQGPGHGNSQLNIFDSSELAEAPFESIASTDKSVNPVPSMLDAWQAVDWLDLDASAFYSALDDLGISPTW